MKSFSFRHASILGIVAGATLLAACGSDESGENSASDLSEKLSYDIDIDYTVSPDAPSAVEVSDLVVRGTIERITPGLKVKNDGQVALLYRTIWVKQDLNIKGSPKKELTPIQVPVSPADESADVTGKGVLIVVLAEDITDHSFGELFEVDIPGALKKEEVIYAAYPDGVFLADDPSSPVRPAFESDQALQRWGLSADATIDQVVAVLAGA